MVRVEGSKGMLGVRREDPMPTYRTMQVDVYSAESSPGRP